MEPNVPRFNIEALRVAVTRLKCLALKWDPVRGGGLNIGVAVPAASRWIGSALYSGFSASALALSNEAPFDPSEATESAASRAGRSSGDGQGNPSKPGPHARPRTGQKYVHPLVKSAAANTQSKLPSLVNLKLQLTRSHQPITGPMKNPG